MRSRIEGDGTPALAIADAATAFLPALPTDPQRGLDGPLKSSPSEAPRSLIPNIEMIDMGNFRDQIVTSRQADVRNERGVLGDRRTPRQSWSRGRDVGGLQGDRGGETAKRDRIARDVGN